MVAKTRFTLADGTTRVVCLDGGNPYDVEIEDFLDGVDCLWQTVPVHTVLEAIRKCHAQAVQNEWLAYNRKDFDEYVRAWAEIKQIAEQHPNATVCFG